MSPRRLAAPAIATFLLAVLFRPPPCLAGDMDAQIALGDCDGPLALVAEVESVELASGSARPTLNFASTAADGVTGAVLASILVPAAVAAPDRHRLVERLEALKGHDVAIFAAAADPDRRGRLHGLVATEEASNLQGELLEAGLAVFDGTNRPCSDIFFKAEDEARRENRGIWQRPTLITYGQGNYALPDFVILRERVVSIGKAGRIAYLNFGRDFRRDPTVRIGTSQEAALRAAGIVVADLAGRTVEVRGWARRRGGLDLWLDGASALRVMASGDETRTR